MIEQVVPKPIFLSNLISNLSMGNFANSGGIGFGTTIAGPSSIITRQNSHSSGSKVAWRASGIKYAHNEIFFDITEDITSVVNVNRKMMVHSRISGTIECLSRLSGQPTLNLSKLARVNVGFNYNCGWKTVDKSLSFIPMDGSFKLIEYQYFSILT